MSAFITSNKNKNIIVAYIKHKQDYLSYQDFKELNIGLSTQGLLDQLHKVNLAGFMARYQGRHMEDITTPTAKSGMRSTDIQTLKSLSCLLYQCSEGDAEQSDLYQDLRKLEGYIAKNIVSNMEEYIKAEWDN